MPPFTSSVYFSLDTYFLATRVVIIPLSKERLGGEHRGKAQRL